MKKLFIAGAISLAAGANAYAADLYAPPPASAPMYTKAPPPVAYSWTGFYIGGDVGYSWGRGSSDYYNPSFALMAPPLPVPITEKQNLDGVIGGPEIGYNWQASPNWLLGVEADFQWSGEKGSSSVSDPYVYYYDFPAFASGTLSPSFTSDIRWFGTVRGRIGVLATPTTLLYGTGGFAYGRVSVSGSVYDSYVPSPFTWTFGDSTIRTGWTAGGGIEGVIPSTTNWTWKIEYLFIDFGTLSGSGTDLDWGPYSWTTKVTDNVLRVGVNYNFH
jgi:outer membrane immunogenic protein